jgi:hypothetical protein
VVGATIDLQNLFGEDAKNKTTRVNNDERRKATMMMLGDKYEYFWVDKGGFTYDWLTVQSLTVWEQVPIW